MNVTSTSTVTPDTTPFPDLESTTVVNAAVGPTVTPAFRFVVEGTRDESLCLLFPSYSLPVTL